MKKLSVKVVTFGVSIMLLVYFLSCRGTQNDCCQSLEKCNQERQELIKFNEELKAQYSTWKKKIDYLEIEHKERKKEIEEIKKEQLKEIEELKKIVNTYLEREKVYLPSTNETPQNMNK